MSYDEAATQIDQSIEYFECETDASIDTSITPNNLYILKGYVIVQLKSDIQSYNI